MTFFWHVFQRMMLATMCLAGSLLHADTLQPLNSVADTALQAAKARATAAGYRNVSVEARPLDNRLRLPLCSEQISASTPNTGDALGPVSVKVRCDGQQPWTIYVRTQVSAMQDVPVLARAMARKSLIGRDDIKLVSQPLGATESTIILEPSAIIGMELNRALPAGAYLRSHNLRAPKVIKRGQLITLRYKVSSLEDRSQGKALKDAAEGELITVTNLSSGKKVQGVALSDGTVIVQ